MYMDYRMEFVRRAVKERNTELVRDNFSNSSFQLEGYSTIDDRVSFHFSNQL
jgi:hypothetical protein